MLASPAVATAPGRVTLLGEHTDYNEGRSLAVATVQRTRVAATPGRAGTVEVVSVALGSASCAPGVHEGPLFLRLAASLAATAGVDGVRLAVDGDLPVGAGLSSSAALAVAVALALGVVGGDVALATTCQAAERAAGSDVGLLDHLVVLAARRGEVVSLDFAGPAVSTFPLGDGIGLTVVDTGERRSIAETAYAARRAECAAAAEVLGPLGRAAPSGLTRIHDPVLRRRARHVVTECARVDAARPALRAGDLATFGRLLDEGHASLRDDFEVSTPVVESVRDAVRALPGVAGVRLTGAGFGGCLVVAHDPSVRVEPRGRWSSRVEPADGARLSPR